jgi:hypothetical protein
MREGGFTSLSILCLVREEERKRVPWESPQYHGLWRLDRTSHCRFRGSGCGKTNKNYSLFSVNSMQRCAPHKSHRLHRDKKKEIHTKEVHFYKFSQQNQTHLHPFPNK